MQKTKQQQQQQGSAPPTITFCSQHAISFSDGGSRNNSERYRGTAVDAEISRSFERYNIDNNSTACKSEPVLAISLNAKYGHRRSTTDPIVKRTMGAITTTTTTTSSLDIPYTYMMTSSAENTANSGESGDDIDRRDEDTFRDRVHDLDMLMPEPPLSLVSRSSTSSHQTSSAPPQQQHKFCNELNSFVAHDKSSQQVMHILREILSHYHHDLDFSVLYEQQQIDGVVFMCSYAVFFCITVWSSSEDDAETRFEFRRKSGDCLASAKFWSEIQGLFRALDSEYVADAVLPAMDFIALELSLDDMDDSDEQTQSQTLSEHELHELTQCLTENDCFLADELNILHDRLQASGADIGRALLAHRPFMWQLVNRCMLNADVCVMRFALLILDKLSQIDGANKIARDSEWNVFANANALLKHGRLLIQKYVIELLAHLTQQTDWRMSATLQHELLQNVQKYRQQNVHHLTSELNQITHKIHTITACV